MLEKLKECQLCGGNALMGLYIDVKNDVFKPDMFGPDEEYGWSLCTKCCFIFQNPRLPRSEQEKYYGESGYRKVKPTIIQQGYVNYAPYQFARFDPWLQMNGIKIMDKRDWNCLDFGCGIGGALDFLGRTGNTVYGVELDRVLADFGNKNYKLKIVSHISKLPDNMRYDLIFSHHSLEHVYDPNDFLNYASQTIKPDGVMMIVVPAWRFANTINCFEDFNSPHNCMFDHVSMAGFLNKHGFFMSSHYYHNQAPDGDWEICCIAHKSHKRNYFPFSVDETLQELQNNIRNRDLERKGNILKHSENIAVLSDTVHYRP